MNDTTRVDLRVQAYLKCVRLVCEAVATRRLHRQAHGLSAEERAARPDLARLPELDLRRWYEEAERAVAWLEQTDADQEIDP